MADYSVESSLIGEKHVHVPQWLDWMHLRYSFCLHICRKKDKRQAVYNQLIKQGFDELTQDLDIVRIIRR